MRRRLLVPEPPQPEQKEHHPEPEQDEDVGPDVRQASPFDRFRAGRDVENFGPGVMGNLGMDFEDLCKVRPDLVMFLPRIWLQ